MSKAARSIDTVRASRAGHTYHERWTARRVLQLVFPKDDLYSVVIEGLSPSEDLKLGKQADDIADLTLFYGDGETLDTCTAQQILQFKYKASVEPVTASYLKKTLQKFAATLIELKSAAPEEATVGKLSFGFVTNAEFSKQLWDAIEGIKNGSTPETAIAKRQLNYLRKWCAEAKVAAEELIPLVEFRAATSDLPAQNRALRRTVSDWSSDSRGHAARRLFALVELVREKAELAGQGNNSIKREDVLDALECDEDLLFPADTRFVDVGNVVERRALSDVQAEFISHNLPVFMHADGGIGKTVFIQSLASQLADQYETVVFDCFGGGAYRSEASSRHLPRVGLTQIVNELASRGICDPLLPSDSDQYALIKTVRQRLAQASQTIKNQSSLRGLLVIIDASDNAQLEADARNEAAFPRLLLASLSQEPIEDVKLLLTARPHRMESVIGKSSVKRIRLEPFTELEARQFLSTRRGNLSDAEFSKAFARSRGNARVLEYLVGSWDENVAENAPEKKILVEELIAQKCDQIIHNLDKAGWTENEVNDFFAAIALLPPPIPLIELAKALDWSEPQVNSAAADLAPMLELVRHGAIFRDEPTETYIRDQYAKESSAQQRIAQRLEESQSQSVYASEALPHFLVVIGDSERAYRLAQSEEFPSDISTEYGRRRLRLVRLHAAFALATKERDLNRILRLTMKLSQAASANARGDEYIRSSPSLASILGDADAYRRLFDDRSGWRGARDARLIVSNCFSEAIDEAYIHQRRAIGWINWHLRKDDKNKHFDRSGPNADDIAAVTFLNVLDDDFSSFNRHMGIWTTRFVFAILGKLIALCEQHQISSGSKALDRLADFAASKECRTPALQFCLLSIECGLPHSKLISISRRSSALAHRLSKHGIEDKQDYEHVIQRAVSSAALHSLILNSKQSAKRIYRLCHHSKPSSYDFRESYGHNRIWPAIQSACVAAWSSGDRLSYHHIIPREVKSSRNARSIKTDSDLAIFLDSLFVDARSRKRQSTKKRDTEKQFSRHEREQIVQGTNCILKLIVPLESAVLDRQPINNDLLDRYLLKWAASLPTDVHWSNETGRDKIARNVGFAIAKILIRHSTDIREATAETLMGILNTNRFSLSDKLFVLRLLARRSNLGDIAGKFSNSLSEEILKDDYISQRGESFRALSEALLPMSIKEAQSYYAKGLAQLDQMGGDDFDLVFSLLHYAATQPGGLLQPNLSHRMMNLCQSVFNDEPSKFGWTLFGRAASRSVGLSALYKLIRWNDQDIADYSYGIPQLASHLTKAGTLDPRRAAVLFNLCEDHGWHEWKVGEGLKDILSVAPTTDHNAIFSIVASKLALQHNSGGWEGTWSSLIDCASSYDQVDVSKIGISLQELLERARVWRETENAKDSSTDNRANLKSSDDAIGKPPEDSTLEQIVSECDPTSAYSLDESIRQIQSDPDLRFGKQADFFDALRIDCPYNQRADYLNAVCESSTISFDRALDVLIDCVLEWRESSGHIDSGVKGFVGKLFDHKGSELFELRYAGISYQIRRLGELCDDPNFVLQTVLETIAKERLTLGGDEWLQLATSLSKHTKPSVAKEAFEELLASSMANVGDEIGEGAFRGEFVGSATDADVLADLLWHLLGDSDAFVRWNVARSVKDIVNLGLIDDIGRLLDRFDQRSIPALESENHHFSFMNAQQWLLMGISRASFFCGDKLMPLEVRLRELSSREDVHAVNKIHLVRCLDNISGKKSSATLFEPAKGTEVLKSWPAHAEPTIDFDFDYEFDKHNISDLARLFGISKGVAHDAIAREVRTLWPKVDSMSDFPGGYNPSRGHGDRYERYREHAQRHAYINAATRLQDSRPVVRASYEYFDSNPWRDFVRREDVSFENGSWLSDHKDRVPIEAQERLLGRSKNDINKEVLFDPEEIVSKVGFGDADSHWLPLHGHWLSPDGVDLFFTSAVLPHKGAVKRFKEFIKIPDVDRWLPTFGSDGLKDRFVRENPFTPLLWLPEKYPIGIDERDEYAAAGAIARPRLGKSINRVLGVSSNSNAKSGYICGNQKVLDSKIWGCWRHTHKTDRGKMQGEGAMLCADQIWADQELGARRLCLMFTFNLSKYYSRRTYSDQEDIRETFVGLKRPGERVRVSRMVHAN